MKVFQTSLPKKNSNLFYFNKPIIEIDRKHSGAKIPEILSSLIQ